MQVKFYIGLALLGASLPLILIIIANKSFSSGQLYRRTKTSSSCDQQQQQQQYCTSSGCQIFEDYLLESIDDATSPCDDFYQFACGRAIANFQHGHQDTSKLSVFDEAPRKVEEQIQQLLENTSAFPSAENKNLIRLRNYYASCMNESALLKLGVGPLEEVIAKVGGFPILGSKSGYNATSPTSPLDYSIWLEKLVAFRRLGIGEGVFLSLGVRPNRENNSFATLFLEQPIEDMSDMLIDTSAWERNLDYQFTLFSLISLSRNYSLQQLNDLYKFKSSLLSIMTSSKDQALPKNPSIRLDEFEKLNFKVNFHRNYIVRLTNLKNLPDTQFIEVDLDYLYRLDNLLASTDTQVLLNFMFYKLVRQLRNYMYSPEWIQDKNCISLIQDDLALGISHEYAKHFVSEKSRSQVLQMIDHIKLEAKISIEQAPWIKSNETRQIARDKVDAMKPIVAYTSQLMNATLINEMQDSLELDPESFMENYLKISAAEYAKEFDQLSQPVLVDSNWEMSSMTTESNAFYMTQFNSIVIHAGIMMLRFFDPTRPEYLNFGSLGSFIGHEITHAFDRIGSQYDKHGNRPPANWWDEQTMIGFKQNQKCFQEKYDNLPMPGLFDQRLNGSFTLDENMADNGGLQLAYRAHKRWMQEQHDHATAMRSTQLLPTLNFTHDQLFWLSLATTWCEPSLELAYANVNANAYSMANVNMKISHSIFGDKVDSHSPAKYRVNIPLSNAKQFSKDFECEPGTHMNPIEKCSVW